MSTSAENLNLVGDAAVEHRRKAELETSRVEGRRLREPLFKRLLRMLFPDQRKRERIVVPPLVGFLGTMRATRPYEIGDISASGFCLLTDERWEAGTEMPVTLQRTNVADEIESDCFTVQATVVRWGQEGVGFSIVLSEEESNAAHGNQLRVKWASRQEMERFLQRMKGELEVAPQVPGIAQTQPVFLGGAEPALPHSAGD